MFYCIYDRHLVEFYMTMPPYNYEDTRLRDIEEDQIRTKIRHVIELYLWEPSRNIIWRTSYYCRFGLALKLYNKIIRRVGRIFDPCIIQNNSRHVKTLVRIVGTFEIKMFLLTRCNIRYNKNRIKILVFITFCTR